MGLYDSFYFDKSVFPKIEELSKHGLEIDSTVEFQTKDLDCTMDSYHIGEDLILKRKLVETEPTGEINDFGFEIYKIVAVSYEKVIFTGKIEVYLYDWGERDGYDVRLTTWVTFKDGVAQEIKTGDLTITPSNPRIEEREKYQSLMEKKMLDPKYIFGTAIIRRIRIFEDFVTQSLETVIKSIYRIIEKPYKK